MIKIISFDKLRGKDKKYQIVFEKNGKKYIRKFGAAGMSDYTIHKDKERRERYISRHAKDLRTGDPMRAGYLSMYILWNKPTLKASLSDYKKRLNVYNKTGKFPTSISGSKKLSFGAKYQDLMDQFSNRVGPDPARMILEPYVATGIQKSVREKIYSVQDLRSDLESIARARYNQIVEKRKAKGQRIDKEDKAVLTQYWLSLDVLTPDTARFLTRASKILKITDIDPVKKNLWWKLVETTLKEMKELEDDTDLTELPTDEMKSYIKSREAIMRILNTCGYPITEDDIDEYWIGLALSWWRIASKDKILKKLSFGNKKRKPTKITKAFLKKYLWRLNKDYRGPAYATQQMKSGKPWFVLNPGKAETAKWLSLASNVLDKQDFTKNNLWYNTIVHVLDEFIDMDPENVQYPPEVMKNLEISINNLDFILKKLDYEIYFDENWYKTAYIWLTEEWQAGNSFGKSKIPDNVINKKLYASIKEKIKRSIKGRRWGAYDSGRLVREYKSQGGKYSGGKGKTDLGRWYKEKWVDACAWPKVKACGRKTKESIAYCRPSKKVDSKTPKLVQNLTKAQIKSRCDRKKKNPMKRITKFGDKKKLR